MLKEFRNKIRGYVPFTNWWLVERKLDKSAVKILDLGCGRGRPMKFINRYRGSFTVGVDAFKPYIDECKRIKSHNVLLVRNINGISYKDKTFDVVLCLQTIEHLSKEQGQALIKGMFRLASKQVILTTDLGREHQEATPDGNELQRHQYIWSIKELRDAGFKVYGIGVKGFEDNWFISTLLQVCLGWLTYFMPKWAGSVLCVKEMDG